MGDRHAAGEEDFGAGHKAHPAAVACCGGIGEAHLLRQIYAA